MRKNYFNLTAAAAHGIEPGDKFIWETMDGRFCGGFKTYESALEFKKTTEDPKVFGFKLKKLIEL